MVEPIYGGLPPAQQPTFETRIAFIATVAQLAAYPERSRDDQSGWDLLIRILARDITNRGRSQVGVPQAAIPAVNIPPAIAEPNAALNQGQLRMERMTALAQAASGRVRGYRDAILVQIQSTPVNDVRTLNTLNAKLKLEERVLQYLGAVLQDLRDVGPNP